MFMKLKTLVKGVVPYHITKIDPNQIRIANVVSNQYAWRNSALSECFSSFFFDKSTSSSQKSY